MRRPLLTIAILLLVLTPAAMPLLLAAPAARPVPPRTVVSQTLQQESRDAVEPAAPSGLGTSKGSESWAGSLEDAVGMAPGPIPEPEVLRIREPDHHYTFELASTSTDSSLLLDASKTGVVADSDMDGLANRIYGRATEHRNGSLPGLGWSSNSGSDAWNPNAIESTTLVAPALKAVTLSESDGDHRVVAARAALEDDVPDSADQKEHNELILSILIASSQESLALFGLAPYPGVSHGPPAPAQHVASPMMAQSSSIHVVDAETLPLPGWWLQATWAVALSAFAAWALLSAGLPAVVVRLFSGFDQDDILNHGRRATLFECVRAEPGVSFGQLAERSGLAPGVVQHHLRLLEQHELVRRIRDGRTTRFYPRGPKFPPAVILAPRRNQILEILKQEPGLAATELARRLGQRVQSTWDHIHRLREAGVLAGERRGRAIGWRLTAPIVGP